MADLDPTVLLMLQEDASTYNNNNHIFYPEQVREAFPTPKVVNVDKVQRMLKTSGDALLQQGTEALAQTCKQTTVTDKCIQDNKTQTTVCVKQVNVTCGSGKNGAKSMKDKKEEEEEEEAEESSTSEDEEAEDSNEDDDDDNEVSGHTKYNAEDIKGLCAMHTQLQCLWRVTKSTTT